VRERRNEVEWLADASVKDEMKGRSVILSDLGKRESKYNRVDNIYTEDRSSTGRHACSRDKNGYNFRKTIIAGVVVVIIATVAILAFNFWPDSESCEDKIRFFFEDVLQETIDYACGKN